MAGRTHGLSRKGGRKTNLYAVWVAMRRRCTNSNEACYPQYGGRGVSVCPEWDDYKAFHDWAVRSGYCRGLTLDRIDNDGNYEPSNCRWATRKQQARNRRVTRVLELDGKAKPLAQWAEELGMNRDTLRGRLRNGWSVRRALTTPIGGSR